MFGSNLFKCSNNLICNLQSLVQKYLLCFINHLQFQIIYFIDFIKMSGADVYANTDTRLRNIMRQYSDYFKQNNLNLQNFYLTQSSHPAQMYNLSQTNDLFLSGQNRRGSDVRSLIEQLIVKKDIKNIPTTNINPARPVLVNAEQRIFQQIINLLLQINDIKEAIQKQKDLTLQMQVQRDNLIGKNNKNKTKKPNDFQMESIINKLKNKDGEQLKISIAQLEKISAQNEHLQKNINRLKIKSKGNLKQVLQEQKQRYRNLKRRLEQKNNQTTPNYSSSMFSGSNPQVIQQIKRLQNDIARLQVGIQDGNGIQLQIKRLNAQNQRLKQKAMQIISQQRKGTQQTQEEIQQRRKLEEYIRQQEQNKILFFEDLKKFKQEYNSLREENQQLKRRLKQSQPGSRAQSFAVQGIYKPGDSRFGQYQDLMNQMNSVMK